MKKVKDFFRLIRIGASSFAAVNTVIAGLLAGDLRGFQIEHIVAFGIVLLTAAGAFAFNDYFDYESDRLNRRTDRPLVQGVLPRKVALITGILAFALVAVLSFTLNAKAMVLVLATLPLYFLYSFRLQNILLIKNLIIAYAYTASIFLGALVSDGLLEPLILYFAVMGFIVGLGFEIMLDTRDIKGDSIVGTHTLATRFGTNTAAKISVVLFCIIMIMDPLPFFVGIDARLRGDVLFLVLICIPVVSYIILSLSLLRSQSAGHIQKLGTRTFLIMQFGTAAYLIGILV